MFTYIHPKTTPIKRHDDIVFSLETNPSPYYNQNVLRPTNRLGERISWFFRHGKVFYQSNDVGDAIANYLKICKGIK